MKKKKKATVLCPGFFNNLEIFLKNRGKRVFLVAENECLECKIGVILLCPWLGNISEFFGKTGEKGKGVFLADEKK